MNSQSYRLAILFCIGALQFALSTFMSLPAIELVGEQYRDRLLQTSVSFRQHTPNQPTPAVVLDIDENSIRSIGPWPWSRQIILELFESLSIDYQAKLIVFDGILVDDAPKSDIQIEIQEKEASKKISLLAQFGPLVLAQTFDTRPRSKLYEVGEVAGTSITKEDIESNNNHKAVTGYVANNPTFANAKWVGDIGFTPDSDGILRRIDLFQEFSGRYYPSLALATFLAKQQLTDTAKSSETLLKHAVETLPKEVRIPYRRDPFNVPTVSASEVLSKSLPVDTLRDKVVLIGSSAFALSDLISSPIDGQLPGVLVHYLVFNEIQRNGDTAFEQPFFADYIGLIFTCITLLFYALWKGSRVPKNSLFTLFAFSLIWVAVSFYLSINFVDGNLALPLFTLLCITLSILPFDWQVTRNYNLFFRSVLSRNVSPRVLEELLKDGNQGQLSPRLSHITVLVADIKDYSSMVEDADLIQAYDLTHNILSKLGQVTLRYDGTIDKFTGDGILCFWGAPIQLPNTTDPAILAGLEMQKLISQIPSNGKALSLRIGIASGIALTGDFGWRDRIIYSAVGRCINLASRIETICKEINRDFVICQETYDRLGEVKSSIRLESLGSHDIRGIVDKQNLYGVSSIVNKNIS